MALPVFMLVAFWGLYVFGFHIYAAVVFFGFFLFHLDICIGLTFDGFMRFSRYRLSHKHPILDKIMRNGLILLAFAGFSPLALLLKSYSLYVSPGRDESEIPYMNRPFFTPFVQGLVLFFLFVPLILFKLLGGG